jgi:hypothetical protein
VARDWVRWHDAYDDPDSALSRRLVAVIGLVGEAFDRCSTCRPIRVLSLCAGDGRDLTRAVAQHERSRDISGLLVELDPELARAAQRRVDECGLSLAVRQADAGTTSSFLDALPADVLLLAGIFGNVSAVDIGRTIAAVPTMVDREATIVWTRHRRPPDATSRIRSWFDQAGCTSLDMVSDGRFAVGAERFTGEPQRARSQPLFSFDDELW